MRIARIQNEMIKVPCEIPQNQTGICSSDFSGRQQQDPIINRQRKQNKIFKIWIDENTVDQSVWRKRKDVRVAKSPRLSLGISDPYFMLESRIRKLVAEGLECSLEIRADVIGVEANSIIKSIDVRGVKDLLARVARHNASALYIENDIAMPSVTGNE